MGAVLRLYISDWPLGRAALSLSAYVGFIAVLGVMLCVTPAQALISTTGYARIASQSAMNAMNVAKRSLAVQSIDDGLSSIPDDHLCNSDDLRFASISVTLKGLQLLREKPHELCRLGYPHIGPY